MKLAIFGSLASSSPVPGRNHLAFALEKDEGLHWFDAGENSSRTAAFMGYAPEKIRQIFLSNFHTVNCGGLPGLFNYLGRNKEPVPFYVPECGKLGSLYALAESSFSSPLPVAERSLQNQAFSEADGVKVSWYSGTEPQVPYSFMIEAEGKKIVYSNSPLTAETAEWLRHADAVLTGTSAVSVPDICRKFKRERYKIGKLIFFHRASADAAYEEMQSRARDIWDGELFFAEDGEIFQL